MSETNYESSYSQNSSDLITSTENYSEKSFEKMSEEEKIIKYFRCILCGRIPLIYYKNEWVYVKCIYCEKVSTKIFIGNLLFSKETQMVKNFFIDSFDIEITGESSSYNTNPDSSFVMFKVIFPSL